MSFSPPLELEHALLLHKIPYQENDYIVQLMTLHFGKINALAKGAQRSRRRFGGNLEIFSHLGVVLKKPLNESSSTLFILENSDLKEAFENIRKDFKRIEAASFVLRLLSDFLSEKQPEILLFKNLGRYLRAVNKDDVELSPWLKILFWDHFSSHMGYANIVLDVVDDWQAAQEEAWEILLKQQDLDFVKINELLLRLHLPNLSHDVEKNIYMEWIKKTSLSWKYFEQWRSL